MSTIEDYLQGVIRRVQRNFPQVGIVVVTIVECETVTDGHDIMFQANMERDEAYRVLRSLTDTETVKVTAEAASPSDLLH